MSVFPTLVIVYSQVLECLSFLLYTSYSVLTGAGVSVFPTLVIVYSQVLE